MYSYTLFVFICSLVISQSIRNIDQIKHQPELGPIQKIDLFSDSNSTGMLLFIRETVKSHIHKYHSETVYVLKGQADFYLDKKWQKIEEGDILFIPKNTIHAVTVTSSEPLKVISIQSPKFVGKDRIFIDITENKE